MPQDSPDPTPLDVQRLTGSVCDACGAAETALRRRIASGGAVMIAYQCLVCGAAASSWLRHSAVRDPAALPLWDDTVRTAYYRRERDVRAAAVAAERQTSLAQWRAAHAEYLLTPKWRSIRARVLTRAGGLCEGCRMTDATCVHHRSYAHWRDELLYELVALCDACHERAHDREDDTP